MAPPRSSGRRPPKKGLDDGTKAVIGVGLFGLAAAGAVALVKAVNTTTVPPIPAPPGPPKALPIDPEAILLGVASTHLAFICRTLAVPQVELIPDPTVPNAASDGKVIRVNLGWIHSIIGDFCPANRECLDSIIVGVMGHEVGHHIAGDALHPDQTPSARHMRELLADRTAGFVLARAKVSPDDFGRVLAVLSATPSDTHPGAEQRLDYLRDGYTHGQAVVVPSA